MYTVYRSPSDYPGLFVVRRSVVEGQTLAHDALPHCVSLHLEEVRALLPPGLIRLDRDLYDDPVIMEVWL